MRENGENGNEAFMEKEKGTLIPSMLADVVVLSEIISTIPPQQLSATKSVLTMIGGKIVCQQIP
ncbi:MAG TPA: hypothetical protein VKA92_09800 [Segetibacter sp.]|nr:hypothetical protein [Segetibacter sp.]